MHRKKAITLQEAVVNAAIALAAAWIVYNLLEYSGHKEIANVASVVCGRYADDVLKMGWDLIKKFLGNLDEQVNNKK
jgi:S-ribosylhomocysteine lyase LuxS involved in autoinducer biosynthesis